MSHFGWLNFWRLHAKQVAGLLPHVREREVLKFLHRRSSLDVLARKIARLAPGFFVKVESVWVDGTPQAAFTDVSGKNYNCELADLLLLVRREQPNGVLVVERGLLVQAKITPRHSRLTSGNSTKLERRLLERVDRLLPMQLYRDTQLNSLLGAFTLGLTASGSAFGLKDCARFLLAPKFANWIAMWTLRAPYQVGWPCKFSSPFLKKPIGFVEAILRVGVTGQLGKVVGVPGTNGWSNIVAAIRGAYTGKIMPGYGHGRIRVGSAFLCASPLFLGNAQFVEYPPLVSPPINLEAWQNNPPAIPIITVTLREYGEED